MTNHNDSEPRREDFEKIAVILNGQKTRIAAGTTIEQLIKSLGFNTPWVVAELNGQALFRKDYPATFLSDGDRIELVRAVSGG